MPRENNEPLLAKMVSVLMASGKIAEAKAALKALLKYNPSEDNILLKQALDTKFPTISPVTVGQFRLGYLTAIFTIMAALSFTGLYIFGVIPGQSTSSTTPMTQPQITTPKYTPLITPSDSTVKWDDSTEWTSTSTITASGTITNTDSKWYMTDVRIDVEMQDSKGTLIQKVSVLVVPSTISPGGIATYYKPVTAPAACKYGKTHIYWKWSPTK